MDRVIRQVIVMNRMTNQMDHHRPCPLAAAINFLLMKP
jgi:hypothetical protein